MDSWMLCIRSNDFGNVIDGWTYRARPEYWMASSSRFAEAPSSVPLEGAPSSCQVHRLVSVRDRPTLVRLSRVLGRHSPSVVLVCSLVCWCAVCAPQVLPRAAPSPVRSSLEDAAGSAVTWTLPRPADWSESKRLFRWWDSSLNRLSSLVN